MDMELLSKYMDDTLREQVHRELAPCTPDEFISRYLELDPEFEIVLKEVSYERAD